MKKETKPSDESDQSMVSPCANCGQRTNNGSYCSMYCKRDMTFRVTVERRYE